MGDRISARAIWAHIPNLMVGKARIVSWPSLLWLIALFLIGLLLTWRGTTTWDSVFHLAYNRWLQGQYFLSTKDLPFDTLKWYGPLWEYVLGLVVGLLGGIKDPMWVRHATTFVLFPMTLILTCRAIVTVGESLTTGLLATALLFGFIRFGGHSILNIKDFPFACAYLLVTLYMFVLLSKEIGEPERFAKSLRTLWLLTSLAVVPYLLRAPVIHHIVTLVLIGIFIALFESKGVPTTRRITAAALPLLVGAITVWILWPTLWEAGLSGWVQSFALFSKFGWVGKVHFFGRTVSSTELPWWYTPSWILVGFEPISFIVVVLGNLVFWLREVPRELCAYGRLSTAVAFRSPILWIGLFALAPWLGFAVMRPVFYDEDRHILFAIAPLAVTAAFGLRVLSNRVKVALSATILVSASYGYFEYQQLSYIYKSPLVGNRSNAQFMGDYWGASVGAGAEALYDFVPSGSTVVIIGPRDALQSELKRFTTNPLRRRVPPKSFNLEDTHAPAPPFYALAIDRNQINGDIIRDVRLGRAALIWQKALPGQDPYIVLARYDRPCDYCRLTTL